MIDLGFITFNGDPVTGRSPVRCWVNGDRADAFGAYQNQVVTAFRQFKMESRLSVANTQQASYKLEDGTIVSCTTSFGRDLVVLTPAPVVGSQERQQAEEVVDKPIPKKVEKVLGPKAALQAMAYAVAASWGDLSTDKGNPGDAYVKFYIWKRGVVSPTTMAVVTPYTTRLTYTNPSTGLSEPFTIRSSTFGNGLYVTLTDKFLAVYSTATGNIYTSYDVSGIATADMTCPDKNTVRFLHFGSPTATNYGVAGVGDVLDFTIDHSAKTITRGTIYQHLQTKAPFLQLHSVTGGNGLPAFRTNSDPNYVSGGETYSSLDALMAALPLEGYTLQTGGKWFESGDLTFAAQTTWSPYHLCEVNVSSTFKMYYRHNQNGSTDTVTLKVRAANGGWVDAATVNATYDKPIHTPDFYPRYWAYTSSSAGPNLVSATAFVYDGTSSVYDTFGQTASYSTYTSTTMGVSVLGTSPLPGVEGNMFAAPTSTGKLRRLCSGVSSIEGGASVIETFPFPSGFTDPNTGDYNGLSGILVRPI